MNRGTPLIARCGALNNVMRQNIRDVPRGQDFLGDKATFHTHHINHPPQGGGGTKKEEWKLPTPRAAVGTRLGRGGGRRHLN